MNCFMSYNPNVAKEVKVTTWIKEFDGASPVYPSFPNEGDVFIVFDNDEATEPSVNKTFSSGDWADTSSGDAPTGTIEITENGEGIDVSSYAYADVNVSGGGSELFNSCTATINATGTSGVDGIKVTIYSLGATLNGFADINGDYYSEYETQTIVAGTPQEYTLYLKPNSSLAIESSDSEEVPSVISGNAEIVDLSDQPSEWHQYVAVVSGTCEISFPGERQ